MPLNLRPSGPTVKNETGVFWLSFSESASILTLTWWLSTNKPSLNSLSCKNDSTLTATSWYLPSTV